MSRRLVPLVVLALVPALAACGDDHGSNPGLVDAPIHPDAPRHIPDAPPGAIPRAEPAACRFTVPASLGLTEGTDYSCGDLLVEENRATHAGVIRVHFIRIKSATAPASTRATIYLDGGPGGDGEGILSYAGFLGPSFLAGLLVDGDFLVISQRGTALSSPFLDCQAPDCSDFAPVADLASYNTAYNADDVDDLRSVLALDKLNVYGISYGSRLGLEVLRRHGDHVRAAVIEGLVPAQVQWEAAIPASAYSSISALNASCAADAACSAAYGDLVAKFTAGVDALDAQPVDITVQGSDFPLDGYTYASLVFQAMYSRSTYSYMPLVISDLAQRRTDRVASYLSAWFDATSGRGISTGLYYGVVCGEMFNPPDLTAPTTANAGVPQAFIDIFGGSFQSVADTCSTYPKGDLQASLSQPVTSAVRTLVSSGRLDPITPPTNGDIAAATLSNSVVVVHANSGHGATLQSPCGTANLHAFLADPETPHDMSCANDITTTYLIPSAFTGPPPIDVRRLRAELSLAPRLPPLRPKHR